MPSDSPSGVLSSALPVRWLLQRLISEGRVPQGTLPISVEENVYSSTHSSEILILQTPENRTLRLLCKHAAPSDDALKAQGHRGGVSYEAEVYRNLLSHLPISAPVFFGTFHHATQNECYLVMEQLDDAFRVHNWDDPEAMLRAAHWVGRLHALAEPKLADPELNFLYAYDREYYLGWSRRTLEYSRSRGADASWLPPLCHRYAALVDLLLSAGQTVIHGEYYPKNVLVRDGRVYPVDWESAAVAAGEIDLASLTQGWSPGVIHRCAEAYRLARWADHSPSTFAETLTASQLYWHLRWIGDMPYWSQANGMFAALLDELRQFAEQALLI